MRAVLLSGTIAVLALIASGCDSSTAASPSAGLTGLGATRAAWNAARHGAGSYSAITSDNAGQVDGYILSMDGRSLAQAIARIRQDLPPDTTADAPRALSGVEGTQCELVDFRSQRLGRALGGPRGDHVAAVFMSASAVALNTAEISSATVVTGDEALVSKC